MVGAENNMPVEEAPVLLSYAEEGAVALVQLNRPQKLNAMTAELMEKVS